MKKVGITKKNQMFCNYIHRFCNQTRLDGYNYCIRHILEDKSAPFRQCSFVHPQTRKRCTNAAEKNEKRESLCPWHSKRATLSSKQFSSKRKCLEGPANVIANFENFCQDKNHNPTYRRSAVDKDRKDNMIYDSASADLKTLAPLNEHQNVTLAEAFVNTIDDDSEGVDSEEEDCLKHAGVYTLEEVARITKEKVARLQALYIDQLKRLKRSLYEKHRNYLLESSAERESGDVDSPESSHTKTKDEKLKALLKYQSCSGYESVLHWRSLQARGIVPSKEEDVTLCSYSTNEHKCEQEALVFTKYCLEHILCDPDQLIYRRCDGDGCLRPVLTSAENALCSSHAPRPLEPDHLEVEDKKEASSEDTDFGLEAEHFLSMDDIASLGLDVITPGCLFGLDQFGEPGESTDTVLSEDQADLMQIQPISINPPDSMLSDKPEFDSEK